MLINHLGEFSPIVVEFVGIIIGISFAFGFAGGFIGRLLYDFCDAFFDLIAFLYVKFILFPFATKIVPWFKRLFGYDN